MNSHSKESHFYFNFPFRSIKRSLRVNAERNLIILFQLKFFYDFSMMYTRILNTIKFPLTQDTLGLVYLQLYTNKETIYLHKFIPTRKLWFSKPWKICCKFFWLQNNAMSKWFLVGPVLNWCVHFTWHDTLYTFT